MKYVITREKITALNLPDEIIEHIVSYISPIELCTSGWERVSIGFNIMVNSILAKQRCLDTVFGPDRCFFARLNTPDLSNDRSLLPQMKLVARRLFPHITSLSTSSSIFFSLFHLTPFIDGRALLFPCLRSLHLYIGPGWDGISNRCVLVCIYKFARSFASDVKAVGLTARLMEGSDRLVNLANFRELLKIILSFTSCTASWSLCLKDSTQRSQGWFCPTELSHTRNLAFISYVRLTMEHGIHLKELRLVDELKVSPYMMIMKRKHRFLFMYDEFKECEKLVLQYDIGSVTPAINRAFFVSPCLKEVELVASHVLYKNEFLSYLSDAINLQYVQIALPPHWTERVSRCAYGCFRNADFGCFTESGWSSFQRFLPHAKLVVHA